jgi:hypothetical protein
VTAAPATAALLHPVVLARIIELSRAGWSAATISSQIYRELKTDVPPDLVRAIVGGDERRR